MLKALRSLVTHKNSLLGATLLLVGTTLASNFLGLLRDRFFAQKIPTDLLDTYFAAFRIPDLIFNLLILGSITAAFIPVFLEYRKKSEAEAWRITQSIFTISIIVLIILALLLGIAMPWLIPLIVPKFSPEKQRLTLELTRLLLIQPIFFGLSYLFSGILNALKRFFVYALAPLVYTSVIILATVLFADQFGVYAPVWGVVIGSFLHMFIQFLAACRVGFVPALNFSLAHPAVRKIVRLMIPRSIGLGALQLMLIAFTAIASSLGSGSVAVYNLADNIQTMPTAVFGLAFITALYPTLSESTTQLAKRRFSQLLTDGIRYLFVILVPAGIGLILLRAQTVRLILGTGFFGWEATIATADTLGLFALGLIFHALTILLSRAFYALHNTRTPTLLMVMGYSCAIVSGYFLTRPEGLNLGVPGLALAFVLGNLLSSLLLYCKLRAQTPILKEYEGDFLVLFGQLAAAILALIVSVQFTKEGLASVVDMDRFWGVLAQTLGAILAGSISYSLVLSWFGVTEIQKVPKFIWTRLNGGR
ncbi:murein biosynthesis integral membrane protein MurJ [Candidatus Berkelbacteria bacterium]|nr:murein biosynthesis integral membrane protein MurJ [Candidatus Berkelbacteria bacterium]